MISAWRLAPLLALSLLGTAAAQTQTPETEVRAVVQRALDGLANRDAATLEGAFDASASLVLVSSRNGSTVLNRIAVKSIIDSLQAPGPRRRETLRGDRTIVASDLATVTGEYSFFYDDTLHHCGAAMYDLVRAEGRWRIVQLRETDQRVGCTQQPETSAELGQAEFDVPRLVEVLNLQRGMTAADIGAGYGSMSIVLARWIGSAGRVYATDIAPRQLAVLRDAPARYGLSNLVPIEGTEQSTGLPAACCDALFMRDVYHHFTQPAAMNTSMFAAVKRGGRLAIIDFEPKPGSPLPEGVPPNRGGHGITPATIVDEVAAAGFTHVKTIAQWPPDGKGGYFLVLFEKR